MNRTQTFAEFLAQLCEKCPVCQRPFDERLTEYQDTPAMPVWKNKWTLAQIRAMRKIELGQGLKGVQAVNVLEELRVFALDAQFRPVLTTFGREVMNAARAGTFGKTLQNMANSETAAIRLGREETKEKNS